MWAKVVTGIQPVNERIIKVELKGSPVPVTILGCYAPTAVSEHETEIDQFYDDLRTLWEKAADRGISIACGDINVRVRHAEKR